MKAIMHWTHAFCLVLCSGSLFACVDHDEGRPRADASIDARRPDAEAGPDAGTVFDAGIDADAGSEGDSHEDSDTSDASDASDSDSSAAGPDIWLAYIADHTPDVDELWAVRVSKGVVGAPVRVNAPLEPNQAVTWMRWTDDGKQLAYSIGTQQLFVVDMTGSVPRAPKRLDDVNVSTAAWSPNGKYLAYAGWSTAAEPRVVDLSQATLTVRSPSTCLPDRRCLNDTLRLGWSADSEWLFGQSWYVSMWALRVGDGTLDPVTEVLTVPSGDHINYFVVAPVGAQLALITNLALSGGRSYTTILTPQGVRGPSIADAAFESWLGGEFVYRLDRTYLASCGQLPMFDVAGTPVSWKPAPDLGTLAVVVNDDSASEAALYLRKRTLSTGPEDPCWEPLTAAVSDFSYTYEWADSRTLLYAKGSLYVLDTAGPTPGAARELVGSVPAGATASSLTRGRSSSRIFYTMSPRTLNYIDYRDASPRPTTVPTPSFTHSAPDAYAWQLSPTDSYVASQGDYALDDVSELYVTSIAGDRPGAPQRVHPEFSGTQDVSAYAWQPVILTGQ